MKIKRVEIQAFKVYKNVEQSTFDFTSSLTNDPANLVVLYAPNGFGKTSFFDAIDCAITGRITRYSRDARIAKINKIETKIHNAKGKKQFIIRNKTITDQDLETFVNVYTLNNKFNYGYPKVKNGSADYNFPEQCKIGSEFFEKVLLSQESIDAFLRETNPEDRYKKFLEVNEDFCELNNNRASLLNFVSDISAKKKILNDSLTTKLLEIEKASEMTDIFIKVNESISQFNSVNFFKVNEITPPFDNKSFHDFLENIFIIEEKINLDKELIQKKINTSKEYYLEIDNSFKNFLKTLSLKSNINDIDNTIKFFEEKERLSHIISGFNSILIKDQTELEVYKKDLEKVKDFSIFFLNLSDLNKKSDSFKAKIKDKNIYIKHLEEDLAIFRGGLKNCLDSIEGNLLKEQSLDKDYSKIESFENELKIIKEKINFLINEKILLEKNKNLCLMHIGIVSNLKIGDNLNGGSIDFFDVEIISSLKKINEDFLLIDADLKEIRKEINFKQNELKLLGSHSENLSLLINKVNSIINNSMQKNCPICNHEYKDFETLQSKLINNPIFSEQQKNISNSLTLLENNKKNMEENLSILRNKFDSYVVVLKSDLNKNNDSLNSSLKYLENDRNFNDREFSRISKDLYSLNLSVENKNKEVYKNDLTLERNKLKEEEFFLKSRVEDYEKQLLIQMSDFEVLEKELYTTTEKYNALNQKKHNYISLFKYKESMLSILDDLELDMELYLNNKISILENGIKEKSHNLSLMKEELNTVKQKIEGNSLGLFTLHEIKDKRAFLSLELNEIELYLNSFSNFLIKNKLSILNGSSDLPQFKSEIKKFITNSEVQLEIFSKSLSDLYIIKYLAERIIDFVGFDSLILEKNKLEKKIEKLEIFNFDLACDIEKIDSAISDRIDLYFNSRLINEIYQTIDPHPEYKDIYFKCVLDDNKPKLLIYAGNPNNETLASPVLGFSAAQINVLALSVFLAQALNAKDSKNNSIDFILIDDPVQSIDAINTLSLIDFFRSICIKFNKQIIISTHDENFYELIKKKMPSDKFPSKFLRLKSFGSVCIDS